jgi:ArsR family transcriptional regulator
LIAGRLRLLAEPTGNRLRDGEAAVHQLAAELETPQQNVSKPLTLLAEAGVLARRKDRTSACNRIADEDVLALCEQVCGSVERRLPDFAALAQGPVAIHPEGSFQ